MYTSDFIRSAVDALTVKFRPERRISCAGCERQERCGQPPSEHCIVRAARIERDPTGYREQMKARAARLALDCWS